MPNIVIIGSGPAGISAALYAVRAGVDTTVLTKGPGALDRAEKIENYYGFAQPVSGAELERRSMENARRLGVQFVTAEAVGLTYTDKLTVETVDKDYPADAVILATGASRAVPRIPGFAGLEGHGVSYCAACDAFFYRGKDVAVLGSGEYALHEVQALLPVVKSVTLNSPPVQSPAAYKPGTVVCILSSTTMRLPSTAAPSFRASAVLPATPSATNTPDRAISCPSDSCTPVTTGPRRSKTTTALLSRFPVRSWSAAASRTPGGWEYSSCRRKLWG